MAYLIAGLVIFLALVVLPIILSLYKSQDAKLTEGWGLSTRYFLVLLRLVIGWHFLVEGLDKIKSDAWSSEAYLRESSGPMAPRFRELAGDRLVDQLTVIDGNFPELLEARWDAYAQAFIDFYGLDSEQQKRAGDLLRQLKTNTVNWLSARPKRLEKMSSTPPPLMVKMTIPERLAEYRRLQDNVTRIEKNFETEFAVEFFDEFKMAKAKFNKWRSGMQRDLDLINKEMKRGLEIVLLARLEENLRPEEMKVVQAARKKIAADAAKEKIDPADWEVEERARDARDEKLLESYRKILAARTEGGKKLDELDLFTAKVYINVIERKGKNQAVHEPLPFAVAPLMGSWQFIDWADAMVKYGLVAVGGLLLVGLLTRTACMAGALFLLLFFLAMPPLPGWPENLRAEGHYLYINKNIIEMLALLALATTRSGRWAGLDGLVQFLNPLRYSRAPALSDVPDEPVLRRLQELPSAVRVDVSPPPSSPVSTEKTHGP